MAVLPIVTYPDPRLTRPSQEITEIDPHIRELAMSMAQTMYAAPGIGLAAPQVGENLRLIVVDVAEGDKRGKPMMLVNPRIVEASGQTSYEEGCLSVPDFTAEITRAAQVVVQALTLEGTQVTIKADGLLAICLQHEIDHLQGRLILDHVSPLKRGLYRKKRLKQLKKAG